MAYFARLDEQYVVQEVIKLNNDVLLDQYGFECEWLGAQQCAELYGPGSIWVQTSFNSSIRKNYAGIGYTYDPQRDAFIPPKPPVPSFVLDESTCRWVPPVPYPSDGQNYYWDEASLAWILYIEKPNDPI
jgi:hypothetical protein